MGTRGAGTIGTYGGHGESGGDGSLEVAGVFVGRGLGVGDDWEVGLAFVGIVWVCRVWMKGRSGTY